MPYIVSMGLQELLNDVRSQDKPDFAANLFSVSFSQLPGSSEAQRERLRYLISGTTLPAIGGGFHNEWWVRVIMSDIELYDLFRTWAESNFEARGEASIDLHKPDGSLLHTYEIKNLEITGVSGVELDWSVTDTTTFEVTFRIKE